MSRPLRIEIEGGWYHVISRGLNRGLIFRDDSDRRDFLKRLFALPASHQVKVHAYCLMPNHFHLQMETPRPNLKEAMHRLLTGYVVRFNLRHRRAGPLFQGRYRAILAGEPEWITEVNRYIHLNPVRTEALGLGKERQARIRRGIEDEADQKLVRRRIEMLRTYPWSSYRAMAGYCAAPTQLEMAAVLDCFPGRNEAQQRKAFRQYAESAVREGIESDGLLERVRYGLLLGSQEWTAKLQELLDGDAREQPGLGAATRDAIQFEEIAHGIASEFKEPWESLVNRRGHPAKSLAIVLCRRHSDLKLREIGERLGGMDYAAVSQASHRMEQRIGKEIPLAVKLTRILKRIRHVKG